MEHFSVPFWIDFLNDAFKEEKWVLGNTILLRNNLIEVKGEDHVDDS